ncbi:zinc finger CCCH domain-containing protein 53-like [Curcuma longa]|uniref:zinc finger CCCH domain-containing protein 53-like n=1 Tax=Curcuma longa TaxID=136217 RepID=UPI003D9DF4DD
MDAYEATRIVFAKLLSLDPENAHKIVGLLLLQENGEKEIIRLAFGPETLLHALVLKARKELGLAEAAASPSPSPFLLRQNSNSPLLSPSNWPASLSGFSRSNSANGGFGGSLDEVLSSDERISSNNVNASLFFVGGGGGGDGNADLADEFHLDQLAFSGGLNASPYCKHSLSIASKLSGGGGGDDVFHSDIDCQTPCSNVDAVVFHYGMGLGSNRYRHQRSAPVANAAAADLDLGDNASGVGLEPCLYFPRGYCKSGAACRFLHGLPDELASTVNTKMGATVEQPYQESLLRSKSQCMRGASQLKASAFPYSPTGSVLPSPLSPSTNPLNLLLQQQQIESQRAAAMAASLMLAADDAHNFLSRSRIDLLLNPSSRQIYLTFPADSTFREDDVSNYFSIYGPVQDVRIPYQQKRMFGFVTFLYPETVKLILAKGNPHFVCESRVLVKPYKEKGKVPDKFRKQQQAERSEFYGCTTPTASDSREPHDCDLLRARTFCNSSSPELLLRRKLEEQQQAAELQRAIELQGRRFMDLQLLDHKNRSISSAPLAFINSPTSFTANQSVNNVDSSCNGSTSSSCSISSPNESESPSEDKSSLKDDKEESVAIAASSDDSEFQPSEEENNLPDSPFASPTTIKSSFMLDLFNNGENHVRNSSSNGHLVGSTTTSLRAPSFNPLFFQISR